jgi:hypothetical protein
MSEHDPAALSAEERVRAGYYLVHACTAEEHRDQCDGVIAWASSPDEAIARSRYLVANPDAEPHADRMPELDADRPALGERCDVATARPKQLQVLRANGWHESESESLCSVCDLYSFDSLPESSICPECEQCGECGHEATCPEKEASHVP